MSKKIFTDQEILELSKNRYVKNVTSKGITILTNLNYNLLLNMRMEKLQELFSKMQGLMLM